MNTRLSLLEYILIAIAAVVLLLVVFLLVSGDQLDLSSLAEVLRGQPERPQIMYLSAGLPRAIHIMDEDGGNDRVLLSDPQGSIDYPSWSPDGRYITYVAEVEGNVDVYRVDARGREVIRLTSLPSEDRFPAWSHDGERIAFISNRGGPFELYIMNSDGTAQRKIREGTPIAGAPDWSPSDDWIVYPKSLGDQALYLVRPDGSEEIRLTDLGAAYSDPAWSPDGRYVAYFCDYALCLITSDGRTSWKLADRVANRKPSWSPDGTRIAFTTFDSQIAIVTLSTLEFTQITGTPGKAGGNTSPSWQPPSN